MAGNEFLDNRVDREFIRAGVDAKLEVFWESKLLDCVSDNTEVFFEFFFKLSEVADVIDAFVEASGELRGNRLRGDPGGGSLRSPRRVP